MKNWNSTHLARIQNLTNSTMLRRLTQKMNCAMPLESMNLTKKN